jgi:signal transduction histidine kinase
MDRQDGHAWDAMVVGWHLAFAVVVVLAEAYVLVASGPAGSRLAGSALLAVLAATYALTVLRSGSDRPVRGRAAYLAVAVGVTGLGCAVDPFLTLLLFLVYPQVWLLTETVRRGVLVTALLTAATIAGFGLHFGWSYALMRDLVPQMLVSTAFSIALGIWISRVVDQSRERAALLDALEQTREALAAAHHAQGVTAERERVTREIHDTLAQGFTSVVVLAQTAAAGVADPARTADRLQVIEDVARDNLAEARALVSAFPPPGLVGSTLTGAVERLVERLRAETGLVVDLEVDGDLDRLARDGEVVLLRSVQEALTNVRRHARARRVVVRLVADGDGARAEVGDDGVGLPVGRGPGGGFGLAGMRGRVQDAGGVLDVTSTPGSGTTVTVRLPAPGLVPRTA